MPRIRLCILSKTILSAGETDRADAPPGDPARRNRAVGRLMRLCMLSKTILSAGDTDLAEAPPGDPARKSLGCGDRIVG